MSTIRIKRSSSNGSPGTLEAGELAYSFLSGTISNGGDRLYFGNGSTVDTIGGKYFTDKLDHALGTLTASSAILVDAESKINNIKVGNIDLIGNTISTTDPDGNLSLTPDGTGIVIASNLQVNDLTATRLTFAGTSGRLVDSANLTFVTGTGALTVTGELTVDDLNINGSTITGSVTDGDIIVLPDGTGVLSVAGTLNYEVNVTDDDDVPNKKYVDDAISTAVDALGDNSNMNLSGDGPTTANLTFSTETLAFRSGATGGLTVSVEQGTGLDINNVFVTVELDQSLSASDSPTFTDLTLSGDLAVNGGDITTTEPTFNLLDTTATTINFGGAATSISVGDATGTVTFNNDVVITGDLTINGDTVTVNTTTLSVTDPLIFLANGNISTNALDIGFIGSYGSGGEKYTGFFRDATNDQYYLFNGAPTSALSNNVIDRTAVGFGLATINANIDGGTY